MHKFLVKSWLFSHNDGEENWQKDFADNTWEQVTVPHDWAVHEPFSKENSSGTGYLSGGIAWYRAHYSIAQLHLVQQSIVKLKFAGAYKHAEVWVNGYHVGNCRSGYSEFSFDITEIIGYASDDDLQISVRLDHHDLADSRWYTGSGINRPVTIEVHQPIYLSDYGTFFTTKSVSSSEYRIRIEHTIINSLPNKVSVSLKDNLLDSKGETALSISEILDLDPLEEKKITLEKSLTDPSLWSTDNPQLYQLSTELDGPAITKAEYHIFVGIRETEFDANTGFTLNGKALKLKGVCLHEDAGVLGTAVPTIVWTRRLLKLKELGVNAIRMSHNPHTPDLYSLCDALGFLVFDEAFDEWENPKNKWWQGHNVYPPKLEGYAHDYPDCYEYDLSNLIKRNRNHPSIIAWSIGNEIDYPNDPYANKLFHQMTGNNDNNKPSEERIYNNQRPDTRRLSTIAEKLIRIVKKIDKSRPITLAAAFPELSAKTGLLDGLEVVGYNYKEFLYDQDHKLFPDKPFVGSENSHSFAAWTAVTSKKFISGQFLWTGIDYLGEAHGWPIHGSGAGLLTTAGFLKSKAKLRQSWWVDKKPILHIVTAPMPLTHDELVNEWLPMYSKWNYPENAAVVVRIYTNCQDLQLSLKDQSLVAPTLDENNGYYQTVINYQNEPLTVVGNFKGQRITTQLQPAFAPSQLDAEIWKAPAQVIKQLEYLELVKQDEQIKQIELSVNDYQHNETLAEIPVHIEMKQGKLLGIENGDLADNTAYTADYRRTYQGKLIIYVLAQKNQEVAFICSSPSFDSISVKI